MMDMKCAEQWGNVDMKAARMLFNDGVRLA